MGADGTPNFNSLLNVFLKFMRADILCGGDPAIAQGVVAR